MDVVAGETVVKDVVVVVRSSPINISSSISAFHDVIGREMMKRFENLSPIEAD